MQYTLCYIGKYGDTIARDYSESADKLIDLMNELIRAYKVDGTENVYGFEIEDENGYIIESCELGFIEYDDDDDYNDDYNNDYDYNDYEDEEIIDDPIMKEWLTELYEKEIEETKGTIENESIWMLGSDTEEESFMHYVNIKRLKNYLNLLNYLKDH